jgi:Zn-dependent M28 family amino/carboxypeptidase
MGRSLRVRVALLSLAAVLVGAVPAAASSSGSSPGDSVRLRRAVTVAGILQHEAALQLSATFAAGNRLSGAPGYDRSVDYVVDRAEAAGLDVSTQDFNYTLDFLADFEPPVLSIRRGERFVPGIAGGSLGGDFGSMFKSTPYGTDITAPVWAVDLVLPPGAAPNTSTSGCEASDYAGVPEGAIIIVQRGTCTFAQKFTLADASPAGAMVFINEGQPGRTEPLWFNFDGLEIPTVAATIETGTALANGVNHGATGLTARFKIDWRPGTYPTQNVIAETTGGDPDNVIVVGAHLDSVGTGPGINDNGSGSSTILEIAEQLQRFQPRNKVRFVWFGAEESGLLGSEHYVASLPAEERARIAAMLNFDMVGSPNYVRFVYDGDLSDSEPPPSGAPEGSAEIEQLFLDYFAGQGLPTEPTAFDGRSDYGPFIEAGIPAGGLFTGAEGIKTEEQAATYGGTAGEQYDPCYHLGCDNIFNLSLPALDQMSDAAAHVTIILAQSADLPGAAAAVTTATALQSEGQMTTAERPAPLAVTSGS